VLGGLIQLVLRGEEGGQVEVRIGVFRVDLDRPVEMFPGVIVTSDPHINETDVVVERGIVRGQGQCTLIGWNRLGQSTQADWFAQV